MRIERRRMSRLAVRVQQRAPKATDNPACFLRVSLGGGRVRAHLLLQVRVHLRQLIVKRAEMVPDLLDGVPNLRACVTTETVCRVRLEFEQDSLERLEASPRKLKGQHGIAPGQRGPHSFPARDLDDA